MTAVPAAPPQFATGGRDLDLKPRSFDDLPGFSAEDHLAAFKVFVRSCEAIAAKAAPLRKGTIASAAFEAIAHAALREDVTDAAQARRFFETHFRPFDISVKGQVPGSNGFLTGYYEPLVEGSLTRSRDFAAPILARPDNLESLKPYPSRAEIEAGSIGSHTRPVVWLRDFVEVFLIQVQGSARIRLMDGRVKRLVYAGRNGLPYTSIGRSLIDSGEITEADMSLAALKQWIRAHGQNPGEAGLTLMHRNQSYVFFDLDARHRSAAWPHWRASDRPHRLAVDRHRPHDLALWVAVLDRRRASVAQCRHFCVPAPDDRAGHRLRDRGASPRGYFLWLGG